MAHISIYAFAEICLAAAKGHEVQTLIEQQLSDGVSAQEIFELGLTHRVIPLLAAALTEAGLAAECEFPKPGLFASRQKFMRAQLVQLDDALAARDAQVVLLKGSIQVFRPVYPRPGMREMADIDLLLENAAALDAFTSLGYYPDNSLEAMPTSLELAPGNHHLTPLSRRSSLFSIEPHVYPASRGCTHLVGDIFQRAEPASGVKALLLPNPVDQLILAIVHALLHDRSSMHGGLFLKALVDCELLYDALSPPQKREAQELLTARGGGSLWTTWRAFADRCFHRNNSAIKGNWRAFLLVCELELRSKGKIGALSAGIVNFAADVLRPSFWRSSRSRYFTSKFFDGAFWKRFYRKIRMAMDR